MGTILDYLREYGDYTLEEKPFSDVDSLVISQFVYLKFDGMVPGPGRRVKPSACGNWQSMRNMIIFMRMNVIGRITPRFFRESVKANVLVE